MKKENAARSFQMILIAMAWLVFALGPSGHIFAQCVDNPTGKTVLRLNNQTKYDLKFGIDDDDKGMVLSHQESPDWEVDPGNHLLMAGALVDGQPYWVWTTNEVPIGQICTWTIEDPETKTANINDRYRILFDPKIDHRHAAVR